MSQTVATFATIFFSMILVNNYVLVQFLGICPFLGVSKKLDSSVGMGAAVIVVMVIATAVLWFMVDGMHVFSTIEDFMKTIGGEKFIPFLDYLRLPKVLSYATIAGVANVVLLTAISTLGAMLYNLIASLVGGVKISLMDE